MKRRVPGCGSRRYFRMLMLFLRITEASHAYSRCRGRVPFYPRCPTIDAAATGFYDRALAPRGPRVSALQHAPRSRRTGRGPWKDVDKKFLKKFH